MNTTSLTEKQAKRQSEVEITNRLENQFTALCGFTPSVISAYSNSPFVTFSPKTKEHYLIILNSLHPSEEMAKVKFANKNDIETFSPYLLTFGGEFKSRDYMGDITVKFKHSLCPVWIKMPDEMIEDKFTIHSKQGDHKGFGNYEKIYNYKANDGGTVITYYGDSKTMYAANEAEANDLFDFLTN